MKRTLAQTGSVLALVALCSPAVAGEAEMSKMVKELEQKIEDQGIYVESETPGVVLSGYVDAGYMYNFAGSGTTFPGRNIPENTPRGDFSVFDAKIALEKPLGDKVEYAAGFRIDLRFGEDLYGLESGDIQIQQAYAQFRVPIGNGLDFQVGKWISLVGYEFQSRLLNPNITHSLQYWLLEPGTHVGILMKYAFNDIVDVQFGIANGWNNDNGSFVGLGLNKDDVDPYVFTGSINVTAPGGNANWYNVVTYGMGGDSGLAQDAQLAHNVFHWNSWGYWEPQFANGKLSLGFSWAMGFADGSRPYDGDDGYEGGVKGAANNYSYYSMALYAGYKVTDWFYINGRGSYVHSDDGALPYGRLPTASGVDAWQIAGYSYDWWEYTVTFGFDIWENLTTRIEYRLDWGVDSAVSGDDTDQGPSHMVAAEVGYTF